MQKEAVLELRIGAKLRIHLVQHQESERGHTPKVSGRICVLGLYRNRQRADSCEVVLFDIRKGLSELLRPSLLCREAIAQIPRVGFQLRLRNSFVGARPARFIPNGHLSSNPWLTVSPSIDQKGSPLKSPLLESLPLLTLISYRFREACRYRGPVSSSCGGDLLGAGEGSATVRPSDGYDMLLEFRQEVIADLLIRHLTSSRPGVGREIVSGPLRIWWDQPEISLHKGSITLTIDIRGGLTTATGRNLTLSGSIEVKMTPSLGYAAGTPYLRLAPQYVDVEGAEVTYAGEPTDRGQAPEAFTPTGIIASAIRSHLLDRLASLPLSYAITSFHVAAPDGSAGSVVPHISPEALEPYSMTAVAASLDVRGPKPSDGVAIWVTFDPGVHSTSPVPSALPLGERAGVALTFSTSGLNDIIEQLGRAGVLPSLSWNEQRKSWARFTGMQVECLNGSLRVTGQVRCGSESAPLAGELSISASRTGDVSIDVKAAECPFAGESDLEQFFSAFLRILLRSGHNGALPQRFEAPGSEVQVEADPEDVVLADGRLTFFYDLDETDAKLTGASSSRQPGVVLDQDSVPQQTRPGTGVTAFVQARVTGESFPPYDYVWQTTESKRIVGKGPRLDVVGTPKGSLGMGEVELTRAAVTLIDAAGQMSSASRMVVALPARKRVRSTAGSRSRFKVAKRVVGYGFLGASLVGLGLAYTWVGAFLEPSRVRPEPQAPPKVLAEKLTNEVSPVPSPLPSPTKQRNAVRPQRRRPRAAGSAPGSPNPSPAPSPSPSTSPSPSPGGPAFAFVPPPPSFFISPASRSDVCSSGFTLDPFDVVLQNPTASKGDWSAAFVPPGSFLSDPWGSISGPTSGVIFGGGSHKVTVVPAGSLCGNQVEMGASTFTYELDFDFVPDDGSGTVTRAFFYTVETPA